MKKLFICILCATLLNCCGKKSNGYEINGEDDSDSVITVQEPENAENNSDLQIESKDDVLIPESDNKKDNKDLEDIEKIKAKVKRLQIIKETDRDIKESTSGAKGIGLIIEKNKENKKFYDIRYGMDGDDQFETYGFLRYNTETEKFEEKDQISGEYISIK